MAKKYQVLTTLLQRIVHEGGFRDDGTPKKMAEHKRGDIIEFPGYEDDDVQRLVDLKAITPHVDEEKEEPKGGGTAPPATPSAPQAAGAQPSA